mmetsp:Transcript_13900/g.44058  ORF Transcript_13900/g.44058 Transcript_13900/m.44058 type:complete len:305 (+) Transcript_13900:1432-2346(+)
MSMPRASRPCRGRPRRCGRHTACCRAGWRRRCRTSGWRRCARSYVRSRPATRASSWPPRWTARRWSTSACWRRRSRTRAWTALMGCGTWPRGLSLLLQPPRRCWRGGRRWGRAARASPGKRPSSRRCSASTRALLPCGGAPPAPTGCPSTKRGRPGSRRGSWCPSRGGWAPWLGSGSARGCSRGRPMARGSSRRGWVPLRGSRRWRRSSCSSRRRPSWRGRRCGSWGKRWPLRCSSTMGTWRPSGSSSPAPSGSCSSPGWTTRCERCLLLRRRGGERGLRCPLLSKHCMRLSMSSRQQIVIYLS